MIRREIEINRGRKKKSNFYKIMLIIVLMLLAVNALARFSTGFCNFYREHITKFLSNSLLRVTSWIPFSVGEIFIYLLILTPLVMAITLIVNAVKGKKLGYCVEKCIKILCVILVYVVTTTTFGSAVLYHCTPLDKKLGYEKFDYTLEDVKIMYDNFVKIANDLAPMVNRDEKGIFALSQDDIDSCKSAMNIISAEIPELKGFIPNVKPILSSPIMGITSTTGVFFPFTYECNYNKDMTDISKLPTMCHEIAHSKGFMLEDECNFIGYYACVNSDNINLIYSGYVDIIEEIFVPYGGNWSDATENWSEFLWNDISTDFEYWNRVEKDFTENTKIPSKAVNTIGDISNKITDTSLKTNGVEDGIESYGRVIDLALAEYYSKH